MNYAIIANPVSGTMPLCRKKAILGAVGRTLEARVYGLDTRSPGELAQCAQDLSARCEVLVIAGGDGTFSDIINAIDTADTPVAFLPLGTGNALSFALGYRGTPIDVAKRIKSGKIRHHDLVECSGNTRGFMMSVGFEGAVLQRYERYANRGYAGFGGYVAALLDALFRKYRRTTAQITVDGENLTVENLLSLMVVKQPYYGYGMQVVPKALFDDGRLHTLTINAGLFGCTLGAATALAGRNRIGRYISGHRVDIQSTIPLPLQIDGDFMSEADRFTFRVLPKALHIKY